MAGTVLSTTSGRSQGLLCPRSHGVVFACIGFCNVLKEDGRLSIKLVLDVIGGFVKGVEPLESATKGVIDFTCLPIDHRPPEGCGYRTHKTCKYHLKEPICQPVIKSEINKRIVVYLLLAEKVLTV